MFRMLRRLCFLVLLGCISFGLSVGWMGLHEAIQLPAQAVDAQSLTQQAGRSYAAGAYADAIRFWEQALAQTQDPQRVAQIQANLAQAYQHVGQLDQAVRAWQTSIDYYRTQKTPEGQQRLTQLSIEQGQTYNRLGQHQRAVDLLKPALAGAQKNQDKLTQVAAAGGLSNAYQALGDYENALKTHQLSLTLAQNLQRPDYITAALNNLGNLYAGQADRLQFRANAAQMRGRTAEAARLSEQVLKNQQLALKTFQDSVNTARSQGGLVEASALLNFSRTLTKFPERTPDQQANLVKNRDRILQLLNTAPDSQLKAYGLINLVDTWQQDSQDATWLESSQAIELLQQAIQLAQALGDARTQSFALGTLGHLYEIQNQPETALTWTRNAQLAAQQVNASDSLYRWQWQSGRILKALGEKEKSVAAYQQAITTLQSIRSDIVVASRELQSNFRDSVEPVYREVIGQLLDKAKAEPKSELKTANLRQTLQILELLKLAELQNYFGDECVQLVRDTRPNAESLPPQAAPNTVIIYSVVLPDRTEMLLQKPDGSLTQYPITISAIDLQRQVNQLRRNLSDRRTRQYLSQAQKVYDILIRPLAADLAALKPSTLVFVQDGALRTVPMAALHDGQQFLVQTYALANAPSLNLTSVRPTNPKTLRALVLGLSVERQGFAALENVPTEAANVRRILGGSELLNNNFTSASFQTRFQQANYPIVHIATHAEFGADAASTFLLTFDDRVTIDELDNILRSRGDRQPVELLTLSACQTATGDNQSALGIAGVAVRAGVKSALASLWFINDEATVPLVTEFYNQMRQPGATKAEALRMAQMKLIDDTKYNHPALWSPFLLIGNWL
jgi:CHAT domain-containing protein